MKKRERLFYLLFIAGSSLFAVKGITWDMALPKFFYASVFLAALFVAKGMRLSRQPQAVSLTVPHIFAVMYAIYGVLSSFLLLRTIPEAFSSSLGFSLSLLVFVLFSIHISEKPVDDILWLLQIFVFFGVIIAVDALLGFYTGNSIFWGILGQPLTRGNISSVVGNVNFTTDLMGILLPIALYLAITTRRLWRNERARSLFYTIAYALFLSVVLAGQTRGVYYSLIGALFLILLGISIGVLKKVKPKVGFLPLVVLLVITIILIYGYSTDSIFTRGVFSVSGRFSSIVEDKTSVDVRILQWKAALKQWESSKILGTGFGSYKYFSSENIARVLGEEPQYMYVAGLNSLRAHEEYLQQLAETGLIGFSLILLALGSLVLYYFRIIFHLKDFDLLLLFSALASSFSVIVLHSAVSFPAHLMPNALIAVTVAGAALSPTFRAGQFQPKGIPINKWFGMIMIIISLAAVVLMSRNYLTEAYFAQGYTEYKTYKSATAQIPDLRNSVVRIKKDLKSLENFEGEFSFLATDTYINQKLDSLKIAYPKAPDTLLYLIAKETHKNEFSTIQDKIKDRLKTTANTLMIVQQAAIRGYYSGISNLDSSLFFSRGFNLPATYIGVFLTTSDRTEDFVLRLMNSPRDAQLELIQDAFTGKDLNTEYLTGYKKPREIIQPLLKKSQRHLFLEEFPVLFNKALSQADLSRLLKEINFSILYAFQAKWDAIDYYILSMQLGPDAQVMRNTARTYFEALTHAKDVAIELEKLRPYLNEEDREGLYKLIGRIRNLPLELRDEFEYIYDKTISLNPGGWAHNSGWEYIYSDYARELLLLYGIEDSIDKVFEIVEKELYACKYMKETHWGIPDRNFNLLLTLSHEMKDDEALKFKKKILSVYEEAYNWNLEQLKSFMEEKVEKIPEDNPNRQKYEQIYSRMKDFVKRYEMLKKSMRE